MNSDYNMIKVYTDKGKFYLDVEIGETSIQKSFSTKEELSESVRDLRVAAMKAEVNCYILPYNPTK